MLKHLNIRLVAAFSLFVLFGTALITTTAISNPIDAQTASTTRCEPESQEPPTLPSGQRNPCYDSNTADAPIPPIYGYNPFPLNQPSSARLITHADIKSPTAAHINSSKYLLTANTFSHFKVANFSQSPCLESVGVSSVVHLFKLDDASTRLSNVTRIDLPDVAPPGWTGQSYTAPTSAAPEGCTPRAIPDPYVPTQREQLQSDPNPTRWKNNLLRVDAVHIDDDGNIYIYEGVRSGGVFSYSSQASTSYTIGQSRLITASPQNPNDLSEGYTNFRALLTSQSINDIATDSRGNIYASTNEGVIITFVKDSSGNLSQKSIYNPIIAESIPISSSASLPTGGLSVDSQDRLYVGFLRSIQQHPETGELGDSVYIRIYNTSVDGALTLNSPLTDQFRWTYNNCQETAQSVSYRGRKVRSLPYSYSFPSYAFMDDAGNFHLADGSTFDCSTMLSFAPVGDGNFAVASVLGRRPVFFRSRTNVGETSLSLGFDPATANAIDYQSGIYFSSRTKVNFAYLDTANNVFLLLDPRGIGVVPAGQAYLRKGWNAVNWAGSDDPDGVGPIPAIVTANDLAEFIGSDNVLSIASFNADGTWETWPDGNLNSLNGRDNLFIYVDKSGAYLPYVFQDVAPADLTLEPGWNAVVYRGAPVDVKTQLWGDLPFASCLNSISRVRGVFWWDVPSASWGRSYYPNHADFKPSDSNVLPHPSKAANARDRTGLGFDDTILIYLDAAEEGAANQNITIRWQDLWSRSEACDS